MIWLNCIFYIVLLYFTLQEDRSRVEIFHEYALKKNEPVCGNFLNLLNAADGFINNMSARIIAKFACYSTDLINQTDLQFYLNWIKEQLLSAVRQYYINNISH
jgi:V-type H+-transporting ATPase subunit H